MGDGLLVGNLPVRRSRSVLKSRISAEKRYPFLQKRESCSFLKNYPFFREKLNTNTCPFWVQKGGLGAKCGGTPPHFRYLSPHFGYFRGTTQSELVQRVSAVTSHFSDIPLFRKIKLKKKFQIIFYQIRNSLQKFIWITKTAKFSISGIYF